MFGEFDHVGQIVRDLDAAVAEVSATLGLPVARTGTLERWGLEAVFLGEGLGTLELFTFADTELLESRLEGADRRLDHVAFRVADLDALASTLRAAGVRFSGPDRRGEADEPFDVGPNRSLWTVPDTSSGLAVQLNQPRAR